MNKCKEKTVTMSWSEHERLNSNIDRLEKELSDFKSDERLIVEYIPVVNIVSPLFARFARDKHLSTCHKDVLDKLKDRNIKDIVEAFEDEKDKLKSESNHLSSLATSYNSEIQRIKSLGFLKRLAFLLTGKLPGRDCE